MSRRSLYSEELAALILEQLAEGRSLRSICKAEGMPSEATVRAWALDDHEGFAARFQRANMIGIAGLKDEILEISDDGGRDTYRDENGLLRVDQEVVQRSKLRVESRRWLLSKLLPKEFGDRQQVEHTGTAGTTINIITGVPRNPGERLEAPTIDE